MKKRFLTASLAAMMVLSLAACGGGDKPADTTAAPAATEAPAETKAEEKAEEPKAEAAAAGEKAPEDYKGTVVVYSPHDADPLNAGVNLFMEKYPNVKVEVVAAGTGELCNRIAAETANPIADVLWGGGADSLAAFKEYFEPYVCANDEFIGAAYKDPDGLWIGESPLPMVIFYNKDLIEKDGLTIPETWEDLTKPEWKGKIAYCLPSKSGSAYTQLCTMILGHGGKEDGWDFIKKLYDNLDGKIVDSSGKCHKMVADGEFYVGLTLEKAAVQYKDDPSVGFVYPKDGTSAVPDGVALVKGCPNEENAKLFIDFVTSKECQTEQSGNWGRRPVRSDMEVGEGMAKLEDIPLVDYDFDWAANEKEAIIEHFNDIMVD
ncbi:MULTISPECIES: ABC transporter substrate-binding protein [unclassified Clostridium]|jgi:iron(III) transport system substrate-binding protein|uniref:ABC transporter substrate-binding protein n=1 Tax=unclassified Clostridium TaxID=2614128 RepID=UPI001106C9C3|nr:MULTISPECIES: ABC transporter substrate-binding protein [unclassified Clostridium]